jgi:hypothetical protein
MSDLTKVILPVDTGSEPPAGHDEAMAAKLEAGTSLDGGLLAGKFKTQEDLTTGYKNAESMIGKQAAELKALKEKYEPAAAPEPDPNAPIIPPVVPPVVPPAGFDLTKYETEFMETEMLTPESYEDLAKQGFPKETVDNYIEGQKALRGNFQSEVHNTVGGKENYETIIDWAADNLTDAEADQVDGLLGSTNIEDVKTGILALNARRTEVLGHAPDLVVGDIVPGNAGDVYNSMAEMTTDMKDPRYSKDAAFRSMVEQKVGRSNLM